MKETTQEPLETLQEIRSMMERSSRFISLSGLAGVFAGCFALVGAYAAYWYLGKAPGSALYFDRSWQESRETAMDFYTFFFLDAGLVLLGSLAAAVFFSTRKARKKNIAVWDNTAQRLLINLMIPLVSGGIFCLVLLFHNVVGLIAPATLIFYGLALLNGSKYTLTDIRYLGICEIVLGLISSVFIGYGLLFWAFGFGVLHIVYGTMMYFKYEK